MFYVHKKILSLFQTNLLQTQKGITCIILKSVFFSNKPITLIEGYNLYYSKTRILEGFIVNYSLCYSTHFSEKFSSISNFLNFLNLIYLTAVSEI